MQSQNSLRGIVRALGELKFPAPSRWRPRFMIAFLLGSVVTHCVAADYRVIDTYPHDPTAFTQGLVFEAGKLYESTGLWGESTLRRVDLMTGRIEQLIELHPLFFGEGLALIAQRLVQLTWQSQRGFVYDKESFELVATFGYPTEGWGLTFDGESLVMSDGSHRLHYLNPETFRHERSIEVTDGGVPVTMLNELEYVDGYILANVFQSTEIVKIDPLSAEVIDRIDLAPLHAEQVKESAGADVLNGIAYDPVTGRLLVTGKKWSRVYVLDWIETHGQ